MIKFSLLYSKYKLKKYLDGYSVYTPPFMKGGYYLNEIQLKQNFDYFIENKDKRLVHFKNWMKENFRINLDERAESVLKLQRWISVYGGLLIPDTSESYRSYFQYNPEWRGAFIGCNVIFDMAIYIGEYLINKRRLYHWMLHSGDRRTDNPDCVNMIAIAGAKYEIGNIIRLPFGICHALSQAKYMGERIPGNIDGVTRFIQFAIYVADLGPDDEITILGDLSDGPLE